MGNSKTSKANSKVLIRDLRKSDLSDLLNLLPICFGKEFEVSGFDPDHLTDMVNRMFGMAGRLVLGMLRLFGKEPVKVFVAEIEERIVGTAMVNPREKSGYISSVMVHPDHRRKGIATTLVTTALNYIQKKKKARAVLHVDSMNTSAISVYSKLRFKAFERSAFFLGDVDSMHEPKNTSRTKIRKFEKKDLNQVYSLIESSEDPNSLRIFDFTKKNLKTPFLQRVFKFAARKQLVAVLDGRMVGYAEAVYTTPKEAGRIVSISSAKPENRSIDIEKLLIDAARNEIAKGGIKKIRITVPAGKQELVEIVKELGFEKVLVMDAMVAEFR